MDIPVKIPGDPFHRRKVNVHLLFLIFYFSASFVLSRFLFFRVIHFCMFSVPSHFSFFPVFYFPLLYVFRSFTFFVSSCFPFLCGQYQRTFFHTIKYAAIIAAPVTIQETGYTSIRIVKVPTFPKTTAIHTIRNRQVPRIVITAGIIE